MNKDIPLLSICIPTYNREKDLGRLLSETVIPCRNQEIEILVFDNGSTDGTRRILEQYNQEINFSFFCNNSNEGFDKNILQIFEHASSRYVWLVGDDDIINVNYLEEIIALINKYPDFGLMFLNYEIQGKEKISTASIAQPISIEIVEQQAYCDRVLHRATLLTSNIINMKYFSPRMINLLCIGQKWLHVHILLKIIDKLAGSGIKNIIVKDKIFAQKTGTANPDEFISIFVDDFLSTVNLSRTKDISLDEFKKNFYYLTVRESILELGWKYPFFKCWEYFRKIKKEFHMSLYDEIIFMITTSIYRLLRPDRLKTIKNIFIIGIVMRFLRKKLIYSCRVITEAAGKVD